MGKGEYIMNFSSLIDLLDTFKTEQDCIEYIKKIRWRNGIHCPHCEHNKIYEFKNRKTFKCALCKRKFSVRVGTIFEESKLPLRKWFISIYLLINHSKGISSVQLSKDLGVTQKTAWFILHRLRYATETESFNLPLTGEVEVDETYIGGKEKNKHKNKQIGGTQGRSTKNKTPVAAALERNGKLKIEKIPDVKKSTLKKFVRKNVDTSSSLYTDDFKSYKNLKSIYNHQTVKHSRGEYVRNRIHTNTVEGFWSLLKRGIVGIYHYVSEKHLDQYLKAFQFRYNYRDMSNKERFDFLLQGTGCRLMYKTLIGGTYV